MSIIFLIRSLNYGGAERQLVVLANALHQEGHDVSVAIFYSGGPLRKNLVEGGVRAIELNKSGRWDVLPFLWRLFKLLRHAQPDVLHGYMPVPNLLAILFKPLFPRIRMVWGMRASNVDLSHYDWSARIIFKLECWFSRFADLLIINSNAGKDYYVCHGMSENKMAVISNGIDTVYFKPCLESVHRWREKWNIRLDERLVGLVGRLDPTKDHSTFLKAAALLSQEMKNVRFVCIGGGPETYKRALERQALALGLTDKLFWISVSENMPAVYNALDIVSSSSYTEGFPNVIGEAMSCGTPCVVTDVGDSAYVVGDTGIVVPPKNPMALAKGWSTLLYHLQNQSNDMSKRARNRIINQFSRDHLEQKTSIALSHLLLPV